MRQSYCKLIAIKSTRLSSLSPSLSGDEERIGNGSFGHGNDEMARLFQGVSLSGLMRFLWVSVCISRRYRVFLALENIEIGVTGAVTVFRES